ncbi:MAG: helicase-related protein, partial [Promethearchaeota archaeon]
MALTDNLLSTYRLNPNLEKLGLIEIEYRGLDEFVNNDYWQNPDRLFEGTENPEKANFLDDTSKTIIQNLSKEAIYDLTLNLLNFIRSRGAINHEYLNDTNEFWSEWVKKLNSKTIFDSPYFQFRKKNRYFIDEEDFNFRILLLPVQVIAMQIFSKGSAINRSTRKFLTDIETIDESLKSNKQEWALICRKIHKFAINVLYFESFIDADSLATNRRAINYTIYQLNPSLMRYKLASNPKECPKCKRIYNFKQHEYCTQSRCYSKLTDVQKQGNFFHKIYSKDSVLEHPLVAAEHTSSIDSIERGQIEDAFELHEPGAINAIVCTPTMELGVDIGNLPFVLLRNVPPSSSSYAQRAGRAGRDQNHSLVLTFCNFNLYSHSGAHDNFFYHHPEKIVSGKIIPPRFSLDSKKIMRMHIHGVVMRFVSQAISGQLSEMIDFTNPPLFPINASRLQQMKTTITQNMNNIVKMVKMVYDFPHFIANYPWFTEDYIRDTIIEFPNEMQRVFDFIREEFIQLTKEKKELRKEFDEKGATVGGLLHSRIKQIQLILDEIQNKDSDPFEKKRTYSRYNTWNYLRNNGFLPNYGFPEETIKVQLWNRNPNERPIDNFRNPVVALREFAPLAQMYVKGMVYLVNYADYQYKNNLLKRSLYVCDKCNFIKYDMLPEAIASYQVCENCGESTNAEFFKEALEFPSMRGYTREAITSQAENRKPGYYEVIYNYHESKYVKHFDIQTVDNTILGHVHFDDQGEVFALNKGRYDYNKGTFETFNLCLNCQKWLSTEEVTDDKISKHIDTKSLRDVYKKGCKKSDIIKDRWLFLSNQYNLICIDIPPSIIRTILEDIKDESDFVAKLELDDPHLMEVFYLTMKNLIQQTLEYVFCLSGNNLMSFLMKGQNNEYRIIIYETEDGGSGYLKLLTTEYQWYL